MYANIYAVCMYVCVLRNTRKYRCINEFMCECMYLYAPDPYHVDEFFELRMYTCLYVCMYVYMYVCVYVCMYVYMYFLPYQVGNLHELHMYICMYVCIYVYIYVRTYVHMYVCVCMYVFPVDIRLF
jgi:hypothetical protein